MHLLMVLVATGTLFLSAPIGIAHAQDAPTAIDAPLGSGFTYQGRLDVGGTAVNATCAMQFDLWNALAGGTQVGATQNLPAVAVTGGLFTVTLNEAAQFGATTFSGEARFLEMAVQCPGDAAFVTLPRQQLTATPYALTSLSANALRGQPVSGAMPAPGNVLTWNGTQWAGAAVPVIPTDWSAIPNKPVGFADDVDNEGWTLSGNADATSASMLGTTSNVTLTMIVSNTPALRLMPHFTPNGTWVSVVGGFSQNGVQDGAIGSTIGGGGRTNDPNIVMDSFGTIAGGIDNRVGSLDGNPDSAASATVGGGHGNIVEGELSVVAGGRANIVTGELATISGGRINSAAADYSTIPGGEGAQTSLRGQFAYASGGFADNTGIQDVGSAQMSMYVLRNTSNNGNADVDLFLNGSNARLTVRPNSIMAFEIIVAARGTVANGTSATWMINGVIENSGGNTALVGAVLPVMFRGDAGFAVGNVTVTADNANDALLIEVDNVSGGPVRWVAVVRTVEVLS